MLKALVCKVKLCLDFFKVSVCKQCTTRRVIPLSTYALANKVLIIRALSESVKALA